MGGGRGMGHMEMWSEVETSIYWTCGYKKINGISCIHRECQVGNIM